MLEFFKSNKFKIIIAVIALLFGMMLYSASQDGISNIPRNLLEMITVPFQKAAAWVSKGTGDVLDVFLNAKNNAKENEALKKSLAQHRQLQIEVEKLRDENEELKKIAGIKELHADFETMIASVVSRDPADRYGSFIIDRGSLHGVAVNDPVITDNGLVGVVTKVGPISSRVMTLLSPDNSVSAYEIASKELGVVNGEIEFAQKGLIKLSILSGETTIKPGDMIVTAGASGLYPKGIPIGTVKEVLDEAHGVTKYAVLLPMEDVRTVDTVFVVTEFLGQGSEMIEYEGGS